MTGTCLILKLVFKNQNICLKLLYFLCVCVNLQISSGFSSTTLLYKDNYFFLIFMWEKDHLEAH